MKKSFTAIAAIMTMLALSAISAQVELLSNGDFEAGDLSEWIPQANITINSTNSIAGSYDLNVAAGSGTATTQGRLRLSSVATVSCDFTMPDPGGAEDRGFNLLVLSTTGGQLNLRVVDVDADGDGDIQLYDGGWQTVAGLKNTVDFSITNSVSLKVNAYGASLDYDVTVNGTTVTGLSYSQNVAIGELDAVQFSGAFSQVAYRVDNVSVKIFDESVLFYDTTGFDNWYKGGSAGTLSKGASLAWTEGTATAGDRVIGRSFADTELSVGESLRFTGEMTPVNNSFVILRIGLQNTDNAITGDGYAGTGASTGGTLGEYVGYYSFVRDDNASGNTARYEVGTNTGFGNGNAPVTGWNPPAISIGSNTTKYDFAQDGSRTYHFTFNVTCTSASQVDTLLTIKYGTQTVFTLAGTDTMGLQSSFNSAFLRIDDGTVVFDNLNVSVGNGNVLAAYGFKSASPAAAYVAAGLAAGDFTPFGPDAGFSAGENAYLRSNYTGADQAAALADTDYFSVTFTVAKANFFMDLDSLTLTTGGSAGLAFDNEIYLQSIVGGFGTGNPVITAIGSTAGITTGTTAQPYDMNAPGSTSFDLTGPEFQGLSTITFQIRYSDSINDNNSINRFDDVTLFGVVRALRGTVIVIQ